MMDDKKNYWAEVAKVFGVELEEKFNIIGSEGKIHAYSPYRFTEEGFRDRVGDYPISVLARLINGDYTIDKLPWKPKEEEMYWNTGVNGGLRHDCFNSLFLSSRLNYKVGNCFKTQEEAEKNKDKIIAMLNSDEVFKY